MIKLVTPSSYIFYPKIDNYESDCDETKHFLLTQIQTLVFAIIITGLMQFSNHLAIYLFYLCPVYFLIVIIEYIIFWKLQFKMLLEINVILLVVCTPLFFGIFFSIFHPTASLEFQQVQNCQMGGSLSGSIEGSEKYAILYVNFELDGEQYLGAACSSDQNQGSTTSALFPYKFYYRQHIQQCGTYSFNNTDSNDFRRLTQTSSLNNTNYRFLDGNEEESYGVQKSYSPSVDQSGIDSSCFKKQLWTKVKIASWICLERGFDLEKYQQKQSCYVNFFSGSKAVENGLQRSDMKEQNNFPLISYNPTPYYPERELIYLIVFTYYFWLLSFNTVFFYTSFFILEKIKEIWYNMEYIVHEQQNWQDCD